jgi:hypothetical protein
MGATGMMFNSANAVECHPAYNGNWWVTENCTWPDGHKVFWNIYVWWGIVTMWVNSDMWIDLLVNKITFNDGKILLASTAKIDNHVSRRYFLTVVYNKNWTQGDCDSGNSWNQCTPCPDWMDAFDLSSGRNPNQNGTSIFIDRTVMPNPGPYNSSNNRKIRHNGQVGSFACWTRWV